MKTVVIWDSCDADVKFFVVDGDVSHLNGRYVNCVDNSPEIDREVSNLAYNWETGEEVAEMTSEFPVEAVRAGAAVIVAGFLP